MEELPSFAPSREERPRGKGAKGKRGKDAREPKEGKKKAGKRGAARAGAGVTRLYVGAGRKAGVRPQDLVGAITGEAGISGREIGAIDIADRFSIVEVDDGVAGDVVKALRGATLKGKKVTVKLDKERRG